MFVTVSPLSSLLGIGTRNARCFQAPNLGGRGNLKNPTRTIFRQADSICRGHDPDQCQKLISVIVVDLSRLETRSRQRGSPLKPRMFEANKSAYILDRHNCDAFHHQCFYKLHHTVQSLPLQILALRLGRYHPFVFFVKSPFSAYCPLVQHGRPVFTECLKSAGCWHTVCPRWRPCPRAHSASKHLLHIHHDVLNNADFSGPCSRFIHGHTACILLYEQVRVYLRLL